MAAKNCNPVKSIDQKLEKNPPDERRDRAKVNEAVRDGLKQR